MSIRDDQPLPGALVGADLSVAARLDGDEAEFARLLRARSVAAWEMLFERHFDRVYRYALARLYSPEAAEDVAAATFHRALVSIDGYFYRGRPALAWLYGIARNLVSEARRGETRQHGTGLVERLLRGDRDDRLLGWSRLVGADGTDGVVSRIDLEQAMRRLTQSQREVVALRYFAGLSATETGQVIGRPETAVYALQTRALMALRRHLG